MEPFFQINKMENLLFLTIVRNPLLRKMLCFQVRVETQACPQQIEY